MSPNSHLIQVGEKSPVWTAKSNLGDVNLTDHLGKKAILLVFYTGDWTNICSDELPMLEELIEMAGNINLITYGISDDSIPSHTAFAREIGLRNIILISDTHRDISRAYGLLDNGNICHRATVLIDIEGIVRWAWVEPVENQPRPLDEFEKALQMVREWNGYTTTLAEWEGERNNAIQMRRQNPLYPPTSLTIKFWGTRGSIPVSGVNHLKYGGNTSCVSLTSDTGHLFVFDCGSGARELGNYLLSSNWNPTEYVNGKPVVTGYILLSHTHWDHIQGFPFFGPVFMPGNRFNVIGWSNCSQTLAAIMAGQMEQIYFPVSLEALPSDLNFYSIRKGQTHLDGANITAQLLKHPIPSTAYRVELMDRVIVYATDHEPANLPDMHPGVLLEDGVIDTRLIELARNADVLIHDAQYSNTILKGKVGWGHNTAEIAVDTAIRAGVKKLVLFHHDPNHSDEMIDSLLELAHERLKSLGKYKLEIVAARDGLSFNLD